MRMYEFTKGPWFASIHNLPNGEIYVDIATGYDVIEGDQNLGVETICTIGGLPTIPLDGGAEWKATGDLIAATPDMYEALEEVCYDCDDTGTVDDECKSCSIYKALRKARGEEE